MTMTLFSNHLDIQPWLMCGMKGIYVHAARHKGHHQKSLAREASMTVILFFLPNNTCPSITVRAQQNHGFMACHG